MPPARPRPHAGVRALPPGIRDTTPLADVTDLLYREAALLDQGRLDEWLALYTSDATYWVPLEAGQRDPHDTVSLIFDNRALLEVRVRQFRHREAHARIPMVRTVHQVGNVRIVADDGRELVIGSTLLMVAYRNERQRLWAATVEHRLRRTDDGLRIAAKRVDLVDSESELPGITCLF